MYTFEKNLKFSGIFYLEKEILIKFYYESKFFKIAFLVMFFIISSQRAI